MLAVRIKTNKGVERTRAVSIHVEYSERIHWREMNPLKMRQDLMDRGRLTYTARHGTKGLNLSV
jgi:hypothetical protein